MGEVNVTVSGISNPSVTISTGVASTTVSTLQNSTDTTALETATGNLDTRITSNDSDIFALQTATGLLVKTSETGNFVTDSDTGAFYASSNPSGFITGVDLSSYVETSETGSFTTSGQNVTFNNVDATGDMVISGNLSIIDNTTLAAKTITADSNQLTFSNVHGVFGYSIGLRNTRGSTLGMEASNNTLDISAPEDITLTPGGVTDIQSDLNVYGNTITTGDLTVSGNSFFQNRPTVNGTGVLLSGEGGGGAVVYTTGDQEVSGIKNFSETLKAGKITLSENSFVTETGNFTLGSTHKGATVLLQNTSPITVTVPSQVSGHTTTFIAETSSTVLFATGAGISGLNSFGGANQIAGIFGQAQIIFKSNEYAFLGGNLA